MSDAPKPIGFVLRHGKTMTVTHNGSEAELLVHDVAVMQYHIDTYRQGFERDGHASVVLSSNADRCIQNALLVVAALVPGFDPFSRISLLRQRVVEYMEKYPQEKHHNWFWMGVEEGVLDEKEILGNFPTTSPFEHIVLLEELFSSSFTTQQAFPKDEVWVAVTHADVAALLRNRDVGDIRLWDMHEILRIPHSVRP